jgi:D-alanyl-D-alanine carboxypeptidase
LVARFIKEMNKKAADIGLERSNFTVPHGLMNKSNISTAKDIGYLRYHCFL